MPLLRSKIYTVDDIYALPEGRRAELIDGELYDMSPPSTKHQRIVMNLSAEIRNYIKEKHGLCEVFPAPFAVFLNADDHTYVEPDISVICDRDKLDEMGCRGAPDWIIEVVSPSDPGRDYVKKLKLYSEAGVREYWIVDPLKEYILIYNFNDNVSTYIIPFDQDTPGGIIEGFSINMAELLGGI